MNMGGPHRHSDEPQRSDCKSMIPFIQSSSQAKLPYGVESQESISKRGDLHQTCKFAKAAMIKFTTQTAETSYFTVLEARSPKSQCQPDWFLLGMGRGSLSHASPLAFGGLLATFGIPWLVDAACLFSWSSPLSKFLLFIRTPAILDQDPSQ